MKMIFFVSLCVQRAVGLSSGGFSGYYAMPSYQADAVKQYLTSSDLPPTKRGYNTSNRAYPDISAQVHMCHPARITPQQPPKMTTAPCPLADCVCLRRPVYIDRQPTSLSSPMEFPTRVSAVPCPQLGVIHAYYPVTPVLSHVAGVAGTSCAAPTASGIIALLNDARLQVAVACSLLRAHVQQT